VRRTVATLLVVATACLMAVPVGASEARPSGPAPLPAAPAASAALAAPLPATVAPPATPAVTTVQAPSVTAVPAPTAARRVVKAIRVEAPAPAGLSDAAYAERLQADLCVARQIFCGLDHSGRYPAR
jgi:hypothetical protein